MDGTPIENMGDQSTSTFSFDNINLLIGYSSTTKYSVLYNKKWFKHILWYKYILKDI